MIPKTGSTFAGARYVAEARVSGTPGNSVWTGRDTRTGAEVIISHRFVRLSPTHEACLRAHSAGVAPLLFLGCGDAEQDPSHLQAPRDLVTIERRPRGEPLLRLAALPPGDAVRLWAGLCEAAVRADLVTGLVDHLRPYNTYLLAAGDGLSFAGIAPRSFILTGHPGHDYVMSEDEYSAPERVGFETTPAALSYSCALMVWFGVEGVHPFHARGDSTENNMWVGTHRAFQGPPELGRLLAAALIRDPAKRLGPVEVHHELLSLARRWHVEIPPFPPPGLEVEPGEGAS